jgi:hypothetical protein
VHLLVTKNFDIYRNTRYYNNKNKFVVMSSLYVTRNAYKEREFIFQNLSTTTTLLSLRSYAIRYLSSQRIGICDTNCLNSVCEISYCSEEIVSRFPKCQIPLALSNFPWYFCQFAVLRMFPNKFTVEIPRFRIGLNLISAPPPTVPPTTTVHVWDKL